MGAKVLILILIFLKVIFIQIKTFAPMGRSYKCAMKLIANTLHFSHQLPRSMLTKQRSRGHAKGTRLALKSSGLNLFFHHPQQNQHPVAAQGIELFAPVGGFDLPAEAHRIGGMLLDGIAV